MMPLAATLQKTAGHLRPHRDALVESWVRAIAALMPDHPGDLRGFCARNVDGLLDQLGQGKIEELLREEAAEARAAAQAGISLALRALAVRVLDRCCLPLLLAACADRESLAECLLALDELGDRRLEALLWAQEQEAARRLSETQDQAAAAAEKVLELARANEALRRSERRNASLVRATSSTFSAAAAAWSWVSLRRRVASCSWAHSNASSRRSPSSSRASRHSASDSRSGQAARSRGRQQRSSTRTASARRARLIPACAAARASAASSRSSSSILPCPSCSSRPSTLREQNPRRSPGWSGMRAAIALTHDSTSASRCGRRWATVFWRVAASGIMPGAPRGAGRRCRR